MAAITGLILLTGCGVQATQPVWRSNLANQEATITEGTVVNAASETLQMFLNNGAFTLRKLTPNGAEQWRSIIGNSTTSFTQPLIIASGNDAVVTSNPTDITRIDAQGNAHWTYNAAPTGTHIQKLVSHRNDTVIVAYSGSEHPTGILVVNSQGEEVWRYEFAANTNIQLVSLTTGDLLAITDNGSDSLASIYLFDNQGNLARQQNLAISATHPTVITRNDNVFLLHGHTLTRIDTQGNTMWNHLFDDVTNCTAADNGEAACWAYRMPIIYPPYSVPGFAALTWLDSAGAVKNIYTFPESFSLSNKITKLHFNGNHHWTLEKFVTLPTNIASTSTIRKFNHYTQFSVITEQGTNLQTITMTPSTYETNNPDLPMDGYVTDGDDATGILDQGRLYAYGSTRLTKRGFVSTYSVP